MMKRTKTPWMDAAEFGASLKGVGMNLLVSDIPTTVKFMQIVLAAKSVYDDEDFAAVNVSDGMVLLHADHTYSDHPFSASVQDVLARGSGVELRLYNVDPDEAEVRARNQDYVVLAGAMDKPHGMREAFILDDDGYCWVVSKPLDNA